MMPTVKSVVTVSRGWGGVSRVKAAGSLTAFSRRNAGHDDCKTFTGEQWHSAGKHGQATVTAGPAAAKPGLRFPRPSPAPGPGSAGPGGRGKIRYYDNLRRRCRRPQYRAVGPPCPARRLLRVPGRRRPVGHAGPDSPAAVRPPAGPAQCRRRVK